MISKHLIRFVRTAVLLLSMHVNAQCPSPAGFITNVSSIQGSSVDLPVKITRLENLRRMCLKCNPEKDSVYARIMHYLGFLYREQGNLEKSIHYTKEAVVINSSAGRGAEKPFLVNSYFNLGLSYNQLYFFEEANKYYDSCISLGLQFASKKSIALLAFAPKAFILNELGDYQKSIETVDKGILLAKSNHDTLHEALFLSQKAQAQLSLNRISDADSNIKKAISILENIPNHTAGNNFLIPAYFIYAHLLKEKKMYRQSIALYKKVFRLYKEQGSWVNCSKTMQNLGALYENDLHDRKNALACYQLGIEMAEKTNDPYLLSGLYINIGGVYKQQQNHNRALYYFQKALNVLPIHFTDTSVAGNPSLNMLKQVANHNYVSNLLTDKGQSLLELYKRERKENYLHAAFNAYFAADQSVDQMRWKQLSEQSKLYWRGVTKKMYEGAIEVCYLLNDVEKAFYFFEKSRAVLLNDQLSELGAKKFISEPDREMEQALRIKVFSLGQQLSLISEKASGYNTTLQHLLSAQEDWEKFIKDLEVKYPVYYQYKYNNAVYPLSEVKKHLLQNHQSLVEYFTGDSTIYVLFLSPEKSGLLKVPFKDFRATVKELLALCSNTSLLNQQYPRYRTIAGKLYNTLFQPLNVPEGRVIISPDDYFIPFEVLLSDAGNPASFLLKKYAFNYAYSMALMMKKSGKHYGAGKSFLGIAPIHYRPYLQQPSLEGADQSLKNIKPYFKDADFLIKDDAGKKEFLSKLPRYKIVQVYSHADADTAFTQPVLYLNDSAVTMDEIQVLRDLQTEMIVLSACNTGVGKSARGEGVFSLARAFMAVGIPGMVTTLWQVDNKATYQLTEVFYKYLSQGLSKDVALQKAKLEFLENNEKIRQLPYFWAGSIVLGNTDPVGDGVANTVAGKVPFMIIAIALLLVLVLIIAWTFKRSYIKSISVQ